MKWMRLYTPLTVIYTVHCIGGGFDSNFACPNYNTVINLNACHIKPIRLISKVTSGCSVYLRQGMLKM